MAQLIILEGPIAAGKTTVGKRLVDSMVAMGLSAKFFEEEVDPERLEQFLHDPPAFAYKFQLFMLLQRYVTLQKAVEWAKYQHGIAVMDRSPVGDLCFAQVNAEMGHMSRKQLEQYLYFQDGLLHFFTQITIPVNVIYMRTNPETSFSRMALREIRAEVRNYKLDYFKALNEKYDEQCGHYLTIDTNEKTVEDLVHLIWLFCISVPTSPQEKQME